MHQPNPLGRVTYRGFQDILVIDEKTGAPVKTLVYYFKRPLVERPEFDESDG